MMMAMYLIGGFIYLVVQVYLGWLLLKKLDTVKTKEAPIVNLNIKPIQEAIDSLPNKILQSITSSANTHKGALGELIGYVQLHASYDRIIPLGNIVDFICIKFPSDGHGGHIDFVDIKTGNRCRLSPDQRALQKLIEEKKINLIKLKVETTSSEDSTTGP